MVLDNNKAKYFPSSSSFSNSIFQFFKKVFFFLINVILQYLIDFELVFIIGFQFAFYEVIVVSNKYLNI